MTVYKVLVYGVLAISLGAIPCAAATVVAGYGSVANLDSQLEARYHKYVIPPGMPPQPPQPAAMPSLAYRWMTESHRTPFYIWYNHSWTSNLTTATEKIRIVVRKYDLVNGTFVDVSTTDTFAQ